MGDTWAPREGAYGRTRDGRRVGPIVARGTDRHDGYVWAERGKPLGDTWTVDGAFHLNCDSPNCLASDLVAEWTEDGPVRTVTRREIVPGYYGPVGVNSVNPGGVNIHIATATYGPDELDAAARVLTELAEALRDRG